MNEIDYGEVSFDGSIEFEPNVELHPGDQREVMIRFPSGEKVLEHVTPGRRFELIEPPRIVGYGEVLEVIEGPGTVRRQ